MSKKKNPEDKILTKNANFDFSQLDYDIDRYIVDRTENNESQQFILFSDYKLNV